MEPLPRVFDSLFLEPLNKHLVLQQPRFWCVLHESCRLETYFKQIFLLLKENISLKCELYFVGTASLALGNLLFRVYLFLSISFFGKENFFKRHQKRVFAIPNLRCQSSRNKAALDVCKKKPIQNTFQKREFDCC